MTYHPHERFNLPDVEIFQYLDIQDGVVITDLAEQKLINLYKYKIADRRKLESVLNEIELSNTGLLADDSRKIIGNISQADAILTGNVIEALARFDFKTKGLRGSGGFLGAYIAYVSISMHLTDVSSGQVIFSCQLSRSTMNYLEKKITFSEKDLLNNTQEINSSLKGQNPKERILFVVNSLLKEALQKIK